MKPCKRHRTSDEIFDPNPLAQTRGFQTRKYNIDFHDHDFYEINVVFEGTGYHYIENRKFNASPGDVFVIPPGVLHAYENADDSFNVFHLIAKNTFFAEFASVLQQLSQFKMLLEIEPYLRRQNRQFFLSLDPKELLEFKAQAAVFESLREDESPQAHTLRTVQTLKLICDLCRYMQNNADRLWGEKKESHRGILLALDYIHNHYGQKLTVDTLAQQAYMSKPTFNRQFKAYCQVPPNTYILMYRCEMAKKLLQIGKTKAQAAQESGFYDQSHMEKMMKQYLLET